MRRDEAFEWWFSGIVDAKGWFELGETKKPKKPGRGRGDIRIRMQIPFKSNELMLAEEVIDRIGFGHIRVVNERPGIAFGVCRKRISLMWYTTDQCNKLCELLDKRRLRGDKLLEYSIWRDAVALKVSEAKKPIKSRWNEDARKRFRKMIKMIRKIKKRDSLENVAS